MPPTLSNVVPSVTFTAVHPAVTLSPNAAVTDPDSVDLTGATVSVTGGFAGDGDFLAAFDRTSGTFFAISYSYDATSETLTLSGTEELVRYQEVLDTIIFAAQNPNPNDSGSHPTRTVTWVLNDGANLSTAQTETVNVVDAPFFITADSIDYTENGGPVMLASNNHLTDFNSTTLVSATAALSSTDLSNGTFTEFGQATGDVLLFSTAGTSITASYNSTTETLTLSGSDSVADYQQVIGSVEFNNTGANPANYGSDPTRIVTWTLNDGGASNNIGNVTETIDITTVNQPPTLSKLTLFASATEEHAAITLSPTLSIGDPDDVNLVSATVQITGRTFSGDGDVLSANTGGTGITASYDSSSETLTLTGSDTLAHYQQVLDEVTFQTVLENPTDFGSSLVRDVVWTVNDGSGTANGGAQLSTPVTEIVRINNVNDPPVLAQLAASASFTDDGGPVILSDPVSVSDPDDLRLSGATVQITGGTFANDQDVLGADIDGTAITPSYNSSTETLTLSGGDSLANYRSVLETVTFNAGENPDNYGFNPTRTLTWTLMDPGGTANGGVNVSTPMTSTVTITSVNDPPTLSDVATTAQVGFAGQTIVVSPALSVSDPDNLTLASATVKITGGTFAGDGDVLAATTTGTSITANYNSSTETLALTGSDTPAHYSQVLDSVTFNSTSADPGNSDADPTRTVTWVVNDGSSSNNLSTAVTETVSVVGPPQIVAQASAAFTENGGAVTMSPALSVTDTKLSLGWSTKATLSPGASNGAADLVGGKLYVFDGLRSGPVSSAISIYDTSTNSWQADTTTDALTRELLASAVDSSGQIYLIDGDNSLNVQYGDLTRYDPTTNTISVLASDPVKRFSPAAAIGSDGNLYVFGGSANNSFLTTAEKYNPGTNTWSTLAALPQAVYLASAVADGSKIYVFGGSAGNIFTGAPATNDVQIYDTTTNTWTAGAPMPTGVYAAVAELVGGKIVVAGGDRPGVNLTQIYDPTTNSWTTGPAMPIGGGFANQGLTSDGKQMFVVGGNGNPSALQQLSLPALPSATVALTGTDIASGRFTQFGQATGDVLAANTAGTLITASYNSATETLTLTGADTLADYQSVLDSVTFNNTGQNPGNFGSDPTRTVTWTLNDGNATSNIGTTTETINITAVNNVPTLSGLTAAAWTEQGANATVSGSASVSDPDDLNLVSATVALSSADIFNGHFFLTGPATGDVLSANTGGTSITASYNSTTETLTLTGTDSLAHYTEVLDSVTYHGGDNPTNYGCDTTRIVTWTLNDGSGTSNGGAQVSTTTSTINIVSIGGAFKNDFNADGKSDVLWQNTDGTPAIWEMNGASIIGGGGLSNPGASWHVEASADFNHDGKADIILQNDDGMPQIWLMNGASVTSTIALPNPGSSWHVIAAADFNNDGNPDILWQNTDGTPDIWLMNGTSPVGGGPLSLNPGAGWRAIGAGDFNGDGKADILWQNTDGQPVIWFMNGTNVAGGGPLPLNPGASWKAIGVGDFNGDGHADILWQNADGEPDIWLMNGTNVIGGGPLALNPGASWHAIGTSDFNGDGKADILWQNTDGQPVIWLMNGANVIGGGPLALNPGPSWQAKADGPIPPDQMGSGAQAGVSQQSASTGPSLLTGTHEQSFMRPLFSGAG